MAREYLVETLPSGRQRFVKINGGGGGPRPPLRRSNTHDGSQSSRSRRVDFLDVTREEYNTLLSQERHLRLANEELSRETLALKAGWRACDDDLRALQGSLIPTLEATVRDLQNENIQLRESLANAGSQGEPHHHPHHNSREREDEMRRLRNRNTRLRNENDALMERVRRLERELRDGPGDRVRRLAEDVAAWKRRCAKLDDEAERLHHKLDVVSRRNTRLVAVNESLARQDRNLKRDVEYYQAILRRHGISTR